jgi:polyisoprenoid-binding protein YceI
MHRSSGVAFFMGVLLCGATSARATTYALDKDHTAIGFKIRHMFSSVQGTFDQYEGRVVYIPGESEKWKAEATIQVESINTRVEERDKHLRSSDFFDVQQYPTITFKSTRVTDETATTAKLHGLLTIRGVEQPVVLDLVIHGEGKDPWGNMRSGFTATTKINRKDFGLTWNQAMEAGQLLVGEEVEILLEIEGIVR